MQDGVYRMGASAMTGFQLYFDTTATGGAWAYGDWAVTAP